jgi:predicted ATPase
MRLAAIYIPSGELTHVFGNDHEGFTLNLGGRNIYECSSNNGTYFVSSYIKNENFIEDFYNENFTQISTIVGANGTGKSSILNLFRGHSFSYYVYEYIDNDKFEFTNHTANINDILFYSPYLNIQNQDYVNGNFKDLSKYEMMLEDTQYENIELSAQLELHNSENLKRWIKFKQAPEIDLSLNKIDLPIFDKVNIKINYIKITEHQTSYNFRPFFNRFKEIGAIEKDLAFKEMRKLIPEPKIGKRPRNFGNRINLKLEVISRVIDKVQNILEMSGNKYLNEGYINKDYTIKSQEFSEISSLKDSFYWFLENSFIAYSKESDKIYFPVKEIKELMEVLLLNVPETDNDIENWTELNVSFENAITIIDTYESFIISFKEYFSLDRKILLTFLPNKNLSSGEKSMYNLFSSLYDYQFKVDKNIIEEYNMYSIRENPANNDYLLLLDEADLGFHPQWKKRFIKSIIEILPIIFPEKKIQLLFTTHDPLTLSDIPNDNIVYLEKNIETNNTVIYNHKDTNKRNTFGANIHDLLADSFFLKDGHIGEFAKDVIQDLINYLIFDEEEKSSKINIAPDKKWDETRAFKVIGVIDEPLIKERLTSLHNKKFLYNEKELLSLRIQELQVQLKKLNNEKD